MAEFPSVSPAAVAELRQASARIVAETVDRLLVRAPGDAPLGVDARRVLAPGIGFMVRTLEAAMTNRESALAEDDLGWVLERLPHDGVAPELVLAGYRVLRDVTSEVISRPHAEEIGRAVDWMAGRLGELIAARKP